jgi:BASS family bile acid:Na+ symporter
MARFKYFFNRSMALFLLAIAAGTFLPQGIEIAAALTLPALTTILTITLLRMPRGFLRRPGLRFSPAVWGNVLSYLVLGNFIIWSSFFLIRKEGLWAGMVLVAAVPPAVSIIPLSKLFRTEQKFSFAGLAGAYLGGILFTPLIGLGFLKFIPLNYFGIILLIVELIALPLILSRLAVEKEWDKIIKPYEGTISDWCFFIVFYALVASSHDLISQRPLDIFFIFFIAVISTFLIGFAVEKICAFYGVARGKTTSLLLLATLKNYALSGGIALAIFNKDVAIPSMIFIIIMFIYETWLKIRIKNVIAVPDTKPEQSRV